MSFEGSGRGIVGIAVIAVGGGGEGLEHCESGGCYCVASHLLVRVLERRREGRILLKSKAELDSNHTEGIWGSISPMVVVRKLDV